MKKINNLSELVDLVGKDTVDRCFAEYMMLIMARNNKLEELENDLEDMNDTDMVSAADLKRKIDAGNNYYKDDVFDGYHDDAE